MNTTWTIFFQITSRIASFLWNQVDSVDLLSQVQAKRHFILADPWCARNDRELTYPCFWPVVGSSSESHAPAAWPSTAQDIAGTGYVEASEFDHNSPFDIALARISAEGKRIWRFICTHMLKLGIGTVVLATAAT